MRILQIHNHYRERGGEDAVVEAEATLLRSGAHEVSQILAANPAGALQAGLTAAISPWNPRAANRVSRAVKASRPDVAHVHNTWYSLSPSVPVALKRCGVPVVMTLHNYRMMCINGQLLREGAICEICVGERSRPGIRHRCYRDSLAASAIAVAAVATARVRGTWDAVDLFFVMNEFAKGRFVSGGLPEEKIRVKPHFVLDPGAREQAPSASRTIVFVGRLAPEKGVGMLLEAWRAAAPAGFELLIVGTGPQRAELEAAAVPGVRFAGWVPPHEVRQLLLSARALVFPSIWYETFGLVIVEAMAGGLPVLASDLGGTPELFGDRKPGWLVPPGDVDSWAEAIQGIAEDDESLDGAGAAARDRYEAAYTPERGLRLLEEGYEAVLNRPR